MQDRPLRADARRNRVRVLEVAAQVFATDGLGVPVHEIARRAGVGTGTVSRHFPTKEDLFAAILVDRMAELAAQADQLAADEDPGSAFFSFLTILVQEGSTHRGLAQALTGAGYDIEAAGLAAGHDVSGQLRELLVAAQRAGAVRSDVDYSDLKALLAGCHAREGDPAGVIAVLRQGLRAVE